MGLGFQSTPYTTPAPSPGSKLSSSDIATAYDQGDVARAQNQKNFNQNFGDFAQFVDKFFPMSTGSSLSASGTGSGAGGAGGPITQVPGMGTVGTWTPQALPAMPSLPSPQSSSNVAFARAKDQVGSSLSGLMKALGDQFNARGISGSSTAGNTIADALVRGNGQLADVAREQAVTDTNTANDFAKTGYQGALTGRAQDIGAMEAAANRGLEGRGQNITMRGQDLNSAAENARLQLQAQQDRLASITGLWRAFSGGNGSSLY